MFQTMGDYNNRLYACEKLEGVGAEIKVMSNLLINTFWQPVWKLFTEQHKADTHTHTHTHRA